MKELIEDLVDAARQIGASDLHFIPDANQVKVQVRSASKLAALQSMDAELYDRLTYHMRYWCSLPESNQRIPQSGVYELNQDVI
ncbi:MAG: type II secretion system protein E, partial [Exiguobacterium sp.]